MRVHVVYGAVSLFVASSVALENGLARTPPMGWNSWQRYRCSTQCGPDLSGCISERLYKEVADAFVRYGYRDVGYEYVNIDDCWSLMERDNVTGRLVADPERFPSGIAALAKYMHDRGLKLGIYGDAGTKTCGGYPGSEGNFELDAQTFAEWGVDLLKLDGCYLDSDSMASVYPEMTRALNKTGRPILYSCSWPAYQIGQNPDYASIREHCNIWRNFDDIDDSWTSVKSIIDFYNENQRTFQSIAQPGAFHDPDMLIIGDFGLSHDQARVQMALWAIYAAPLLMSNDLISLERESRRVEKEILTNRHVIAVNQDKLGVMGSMLNKTGDIELYIRELLPIGSRAIAIVNRAEGGPPASYVFNTDEIGLDYKGGYIVRDLFHGNHLIAVVRPGDNFTVHVNPSGVRFFKATVLP